CACARFQVTPKTLHLHVVKIFFRYLKGQPKLCLWYLRDSPFDLEAFFDSDYAGASLDRKSAIGSHQFLGKRGDPKGGKITSKGKISKGKLDFEDVYFVKELKFNIFSVSQMCDKKNSVLFIDSECVVLSPNFKLLDESQVLLRVPRQNNMYSVDLRNVVPSGGIENLIDHKVKIIRRDIGTEFKNKDMNQFCEMKGRKHALSFMRPFGCHVTILNILDHLDKFDGKADKEFFLGYSTHSKAFRVFNTITKIVEEKLHITFLENKPNVAGIGPNWMFDIDSLTLFMTYQSVFARNQSNGNAGPKNSEDEVTNDAGKKSTKVLRKENRGIQQKKAANINSTNRLNTVSSFFITVDPGREREQRNEFKSMFGQDKDVNGNRIFTPIRASRSTYVYLGGSIPVNAATLPNADLSTDPLMPDLEDNADLQDSGIFWIEAIRLFLAYASFMRFIMYQIYVKSAFLFGTIEKEVYVCQPPSFEDPHFPNKVYQVEKALYGLHQAPRAWYETLSTYLLENRFRRGIIDKTLFIKKDKGDILSVELTFFLGLQVMQKDDGIFMSHDKYVADILKKFDFSSVKTASTPIETNKALLKDEEDVDVNVYLYRSMIRSLMYLTASRLDIMFAVCACARFQVTPKVSHLHAMKRIFRYLKGQSKLGLLYLRDSPFDLEAFSDSDYAGAIVANSTTKAEYVAAANYCGQDSAKVKTVNEDVQIRALIDGKKIIVTKASIRRDLQLQDAEGTACLPNDTIFEELVLDLEKAKTTQAKEIANLKKRVKKLERKKKSRTSGRVIDNINQDVEITLVDETQGRMNEEDMFGINDLDGDEVIVDVTAGENVEQSTKVVEKEISTVDPVTIVGEVVTTAEDVEVTTAATTPQISKDELTLAQILIKIKAAKPKARGVIIQDPSEFRTTSSSQPSQLPQAKDKGKGIMVDPEKPLKKKALMKRLQESLKLR
nr:hypothetical protein [Tanacetum cinerariifolium]